MKPFTVYQLEVDEDAEEVVVTAFDEDNPGDTFRARLTLEELAPFLRRLDRALHRA